MSRNKLISQYAALNTPDLPQRIFNEIKSYIETNGIDNLPYLELNGRHTGKLSISNGGWRGDFDLLCPLLEFCRINRHAVVSPDMVKIEKIVNEWKDMLMTPTDYDIYLGVDDSNFNQSGYDDDDVNEFRSAAYAAENDSFIKSGLSDIVEHDKALSEIDRLCDHHQEREGIEVPETSLFADGYLAQRIDNPEQLKKLFETMASDAEENRGIVWTNPDFDIDQLFEEQEIEEGPSWLEFVDDLRNGRFGELPEDYDGLAEPDS